MSARGKPRQKEIEKLAQKLVELVRILRRDGPASDWRWWGKQSARSVFKPPYPYQDGLPIFDALVRGVRKLNPDMLSDREIARKLAYEFLEPQTSGMYESDHLKNESLVNEAKNHLNMMVEFEAWQNVDIPIVNLQLEGDSVELGNVTFMTIKEQELAKWKDRPLLWSPTEYDVEVLARVRAPGDLERALSYARSQVDQVLNVLRAFSTPFGWRSDIWQIGMLGGTISTAAIPMRINGRRFADLSSTQTSFRPALLELRQHILSKLEQPQWELINNMMQKGQPSEMESKLLNGIQWLGESTKPDTNDAKFAKICFSLETMIGGEPKDENLQVRGITAMLAERTAFVAGQDQKDRSDIDSKEPRLKSGL